MTQKTTMIKPKSEAGKELKKTYGTKIREIEESTGRFDRSGPGSKHEKMNELRKEFNMKLSEVEEVYEEDMKEASRPQMNEPKTEPGRELRKTYEEKIAELENSGKDFPRSGPGSLIELVNDLRVKYNDLLEEIEKDKNE